MYISIMYMYIYVYVHIFKCTTYTIHLHESLYQRTLYIHIIHLIVIYIPIT